MRVALLIEAWKPIWGGGQVHVLELSKKLAENHNCEIDIFTMNFLDENGKIQPEVESLIDGKIRLIRIGKIRTFGFKDRIFWMFNLIRAVKKYNRKKKYDLIHAQANLPGIPGKILSKKLELPIVYTIHGSNFLDLNKKNLFYIIEKILYTKIRYNREISVSKRFLDYKNKNEVICIPNGVDIEKFDRAHEKYAPAKDNDKFKILFVGRLDKIKGIDVLLKSLRQIKKDLIERNAEISLVGYGYDENELKNISRNFSLENLVHFKGKLVGENLLKEYIISDLFILPSRSEGQPLTLLEAWAAKLPVIVTDVGDNRFFVKNGENGYIIPPNDANGLSAKILEAIKNPDLSRMGKGGYAMVKEKYSWKNVAEKTYKTYEEASK